MSYIGGASGGGGSGGRTILTGNLDLYANASTGSDSYNGLSATFTGGVNGPKATLQNAWDTSVAIYDLSVFALTINCAASGTPYILSAQLSFIGNWNGQAVQIQGAGSASTTINDCLISEYSISGVNIDGFTLADGGSGYCLQQYDGGYLVLGNDIIFEAGAATAAHIFTEGAEGAIYTGDYSVVGNAKYHWWAWQGGQIYALSSTITLTGTPAFSGAFAYAQDLGLVNFGGLTIVGSATGPRFLATGNGVVSPNFGFGESTGTALPGNAPGSVSSGGQYFGITDYYGNVAGLPAGLQGATIFVTDALTPSSGQAVVGGDAQIVPVFWNNTVGKWLSLVDQYISASGIQIDDIGTKVSANPVTSTITNSSITVGLGGGSNLALVATLCYENSSLSVPSSSAIAWDPLGANQALTLIQRSSVSLGGGAYGWSELWGLVAPTSGNKNLVATVAGSNYCTFNGVSFSDVDQTGGSTTFYGAATNSDAAATSASVGPITVSIGDAAIECIDTDGSQSGPLKTQIYTDNSNSNASSYALISSGSTVTLGWGTVTPPWAEVACGIKAV